LFANSQVTARIIYTTKGVYCDLLVGFMAEQKFLTPLKVGLLAVVTSYFLFTLHAMFTLSWIGEWDRMGGGPFGTMILVEDISATIGLVFRFIASILALAAIIAYFVKKNLAKSTAYKVARWIMVFEGIYWLGLIATAGYSVQGFWLSLSYYRSIVNLLYSLLLNAIPTVVEAVILPIVLFIFAFKLNPNKPLKGAIKWGLISGTIFVVVFWLINTGMWVSVIREKGIEYLWKSVTQVNGAAVVTLHPEHLVSFVTTAFGLLALAIYAAYFTKKSSRTETLQNLKVGTIGVMVLALGMYFFWNYFSWVFFAGNTWNNWYAWFLGHNLDLWMLALPLVALPLLYYSKYKNTPKQS
jgi:hypothetical protein